ncbi:unnamed protein product [Discosporangium mesarthrocarpum]
MGRMKRSKAYEVLGLNGEEDEVDIKKAYRNLSRKLHPDKCKDPDATAKFQEVSNGYLVLANRNYHSNDEEFLDDEDGDVFFDDHMSLVCFACCELPCLPLSPLPIILSGLNIFAGIYLSSSLFPLLLLFSG